jgi:hypothetical protein
VYSFSHLTLQEYLTAQYIADNNLIEQLVTGHLSDPRWREVFLLVAGLVRAKNGADDLLLLMEKEAQKYINTPNLQGLLQWADEVTKDSEGDFKPVGKRAAAIAYARAIAEPYANFANANIAIANANANFTIATAIGKTNAIGNANAIAYTDAIVYAVKKTIDYPYSNAIENVMAIARDISIAYSIVLAQEFEEIKIFKDVNLTQLIAQQKELQKQFPDADQPEQIHLAFLDRFLDTWCNALHLDPEIVKLSKEEVEALGDYFSANNFIIQCKEAAVRISAKTWEEIESRMLVVPENSTI